MASSSNSTKNKKKKETYFHSHRDDENFLLSPVDHVSFERIDGSVVSNETQPFWRENDENENENGELTNEFNSDIIIFIENIQDVQFNKRSVRTQYTKNLKGRRPRRGSKHGGDNSSVPASPSQYDTTARGGGTASQAGDEQYSMYEDGGYYSASYAGASYADDGSSTRFGTTRSARRGSVRHGATNATSSVKKSSASKGQRSRSQQSRGTSPKRGTPTSPKRRESATGAAAQPTNSSSRHKASRHGSIGESKLILDSDLRNALDVGELYYTPRSNRGGGGGVSVASSIDSEFGGGMGAGLSLQGSTAVEDSVISDLTDVHRSYYDRGGGGASVGSCSSFTSLNKHRSIAVSSSQHHQSSSYHKSHQAGPSHNTSTPPTPKSIYQSPGGATATTSTPNTAHSSIYQSPGGANYFRTSAPDTILEQSERSEASFRGSRYSPHHTKAKLRSSIPTKMFVGGETSTSTIDTHDLTVSVSEGTTRSSLPSLHENTNNNSPNSSPTTTPLSPASDDNDVFSRVRGLEIEFDVHGQPRKGRYSGMIVRGKNKDVPHDEYGHIQFENGDLYDGPFHYGFMQGSNATFQWKQGDVYRGDMYLNMRHGEGEYVTVHQRRYVGSYKKDVPHGYGILYNSDKTIFHLGQWYKGRPDEEDAAAASHYNKSKKSKKSKKSRKKNKNSSSHITASSSSTSYYATAVTSSASSAHRTSMYQTSGMAM
eukprot:CAMPEP_0194034482 /NCGR_PEP_ID=MMETSP0009_2-20130614/6893_1 /TAXON_ID=210454 /ORGANISM="Grammatophora oceanica, Strain CCMP 410" /LENGTH=711 /DNA_ID=CAMNT_0038675423 /DNA_START=103 /DNA_END=2238 /DNA_ORIENTATION=+